MARAGEHEAESEMRLEVGGVGAGGGAVVGLGGGVLVEGVLGGGEIEAEVRITGVASDESFQWGECGGVVLSVECG